MNTCMCLHNDYLVALLASNLIFIPKYLEVGEPINLRYQVFEPVSLI
jgi:hypothetical protein